MGQLRPGVRFTNIDPPEDNGCDGCMERKSLRAFCSSHHTGPCTWCGGRGFAPKEGRWTRCSCTVGGRAVEQLGSSLGS